MGGRYYESEGPGAIYRLSTLLYLDGHRGLPYKIHDDRSPTGGPGGLAMRGLVRNWARPAGAKTTFDARAKPDMEFDPDQEATIRVLAGGAEATGPSARFGYQRAPRINIATSGQVHGVGTHV